MDKVNVIIFNKTWSYIENKLWNIVDNKVNETSRSYIKTNLMVNDMTHGFTSSNLQLEINEQSIF